MNFSLSSLTNKVKTFLQKPTTQKVSLGLLPQPEPIKPEGDKQGQKHPSAEYTSLKQKFRDVGRLAAIAETLGRDFLTAMPDGATKSRLSQLSFLHGKIQEEIRDPQVPEFITSAKEHQSHNPSDWDIWDRANLREIENEYREHACLSPEIMEQCARLSYDGRRIHRDCLKENDWETASTFLEKIVDLKRQVGEQRCPSTGNKNPYQALLNEYIPHLSVDEIDGWFKTLDTELTPLTKQIILKQSDETPPIPFTQKFSAKSQMWLNRSLLDTIGFDFKRGGLFETGHHPVEGGTPEDTRLVIRHVNEKNFLNSMTSALHEGGHGLYIQGLPRDVWRYQPVGQDMSAAIHESQALLIEMFYGRSKAFFEFLSPRLQGVFHNFHDPSLSAENLYKHKNTIGFHLKRQNADEMTYFFHVYIRFQLERRLIDGSLKVKDLPDAWSELTEKYLKLTPKKPSEGCLQDVHWFVGKIGYFPSYIIGQMIAAQIHTTLDKKIENIETKIKNGDFHDIKHWLNKKIHEYGRIYDTQALVKKATGDEISTKALIKHFRKKYLD